MKRRLAKSLLGLFFAGSPFFIFESFSQQIDIKGLENISISNDALGTPDITNGTDFGSVPVVTTGARILTVENLDVSALNVSSVSSDNPRFAISGFTSGVVGSLSTQVFTITFTPIGLGPESALITIISDDGFGNDTYEFNIAASAIDHFETAVAGDWSDLVTWGSTTTLPTSSDNVIIYHDVTLDVDAVVNDYTLDFVNFDFGTFDLEVLGDLVVGGVFQSQAGAVLSLTANGPQSLDFGCENIQTVVFGGSGVKSMTGSGFDVQELLWIKDDAVLQANGIRIALEQNANWLEEDNGYFDPVFASHYTYLRGTAHSITTNPASHFGNLQISTDVTFASDIDAEFYIGANDVDLDLGSNTIKVRQNWQFGSMSSFNLIYSAGAIIDFADPGTLYFEGFGSENYPEVRISGGGNASFYGSLNFNDDLNIDNGGVSASGIYMYFTGGNGINIASGSSFNIYGSSSIAFDLGSINNEGYMQFEGWDWESFVAVSGNGYTIESTGGSAQIGATYTNFSGLGGNGISILGGSVNASPYNFSNTRLSGSGTALLTFGDVDVYEPISKVEFYSGSTYNVQKTAGSQTITIFNPSGDFASETFENQVSGSIEWLYPANALLFDGLDDYVEIADSPTLDITTALTLEAWINPLAAPADYQPIIAKANPDLNERSYALFVGTDMSLVMAVSELGTDYDALVASTYPLETGVWQHVTGVYQTGSLKVYINGELAGEETIGIPSAVHSGSATLNFGTYSNAESISEGSVSDALAMELDEVRVWNTARDQFDIQTDLFSELLGSEVGLMAYYSFNTDEGTAVVDATGNGNDGTLKDNNYISNYADGISNGPLWIASGAMQPIEGPIYVNASAVGGNNGTSWVDAFYDLQDALGAAQDGDEIWIANGIYKPDGINLGNTSLSFVITQNDLSIFGGFSGTESSLAERYADPSQTVLTGDLNGDDDLSFSNVLDNANNVVLINNVTGVYIDGLTIKGGNAAAYGGGISSSVAEFTLNQVFVEYCLAGTSGGGAYVVGGDVAILNSHFQNNYATTGGGAYLNTSEPFIYRSVFQYNDAVSGGGLYLEGSNLIDNSVSYYNKFLNNGATAVTGGGVYLEESYFEAFQNLFAGNYAYDYGGAINVDNLSTFTSVNSTVADNASNDGSGGLNFSSGATIRIDNTIFWGNTSVAQLASYQSINDGGAFVINHSIVQEWDKNIYSSAAANNVNGLDPMFVNSANGDYRLLLASPAIDLGNDMLLEQLFYIDIFDEDQDADYLEYAPFDLAKNPRYYGSSVDVGAYEHQGNPDPVAFLYVNGSALGNNDGSSWADAFTDLQDALTSATEGTEIWVAAGTYYPSGDDPSVSFVIPSGASVYGGFNGTESSLPQRDIVSNITILEGDSPNFLNSYLVVYIAGTGNNARLDGFTISGGNGEYGTDNYGGGIKIEGGAEPILANLTIQLNQNDFGAGLYVNGGIVVIENTTFASNTVINFGTGGAIYADNALLKITNTRFTDNTAWEAGGVYLSNSSSLTAVNIDFDSNSAFGLNGGAIEAVNSDVSITNGRFYNNYGNPGAGILFSSTSADHDLELNQTTFTTTYSSDGVAIRSSGGFYSSAIINNSIFWANVGSQISIVDDGSNLSVSSSIIDGWNISDYSGFSGSIIEANIGTGDPLFTNILTGDLTITDGSSAQDFGSVILLPFDDLDIDGDHVTVEILPLDLAGNPRVSNAQVDAGAYEIQVASIPFTVTASDAEVASADHLYPETDFLVAGVSVNVTEATVLNMMRYTTNTDLMASLAGYKLVHSADATFSTAGDNVVVASSPLASMTDLEFSGIGYSLSPSLHYFFLVASSAIEANQTQPGITFSLDENGLTFSNGVVDPFSYTSPVSTFSAAPTYSATLQNPTGSEVNVTAGTSDVTLMELLVGADPYGEVTNLVVNFSQDPGTNLQNYRLVVSFDNSLATTFDNDIINGSNLTGSSVAFGPIAGGVYAAGKSFFVVADVPASAPGIPSPITFSVDDASFTTAFGAASGINITSDPFSVAEAISALPATNISTFGFTANWNLAAGVDGYRLEVSEDAFFTNLLPGYGPLEITGNTADVSGLYHATTYFYRVKAFTGTVETSYSNAVEVKTLKSAELTSDSTALVNIYDEMGGAGWTSSANWKVSQVRGWSGVVVENSRVTALNLSSNNVTGAFPTLTDTELDALQQLDLSNNQVTTVPANANLGALQVLDLSSNQLDFGSLEQFASVPTFTYSPQAALFTAVDLLQERGEALSIDRTSAGASNQYQWYKNGTAVDGATGPVYTIAFPTFAEEGSYTALVTNSLLPNLTLTTLPINLRVSSLERDRLILTEIYNLTGGDSWNNNTNWNTADIGSWFGVTVANDRVTGITLASNNLVGELPLQLGDMRRLTVIDISNNEVSSLPALTNIIELTTLNVSNNRLQFDDLEPNIGIASITYAPQKLTGQARDEKIAVNTAVTVEVPVGGTANSYQWYHNGSSIAAGTGSSYQLGPIRYENMGSYELEITSNKVAGLTLRSEVQRVLGTATIMGSIIDLNNASVANANGALLGVKTGAYDTTGFYNSAANGGFEIKDIVLGDYLLYGEQDKQVYIPSYYRSTIDWVFADLIQLRDNIGDLVLTMVNVPRELTPADGDNTFKGLFESDFGDTGGKVLDRKRVQGAGVSVSRSRFRAKDNEDDYELIAYVQTDETGQFEMNNLPDGDYRVNIQYPGIPMDPSSFIDFQLGGGSGVEQNSIRINALATPTSIVVTKVEETGIYLDYFKGLTVYPNPADKFLTIRYEKLVRTDVVADLMDLTGQTIRSASLEQGSNRQVLLDVDGVRAGIYILRFYDTAENGGGITSLRIIISR
jgi:Leucine-rich repeat (LRR) protein